MADLRFACLDARADRFAAAPTLLFPLRVTEAGGGAVHAVALRCQIRIEPQRRRYSAAEAELLADLFGAPSRWGETLRPLQFANVSLMVPGFTGATQVDLPVPVTYDLEVAAGKYFAALDDGEIPLLMLFSGTVFARTGTGLSVEQVPWDREARHRLPVAVWRELMDRYFPGEGWLRLRTDTLRALHLYKSAHALATWDDAVAALLAQAKESAP
ncbi:DUF6084 family protein [Thermoactinospora rubra]|uniref:DUF6084 family protein n=1 Tax=Thermoactinospora rubra TaxID=1088767 RepID=UPI000A1043A0|nr:DUF6084 family protein [Thermoactinospora rubra]